MTLLLALSCFALAAIYGGGLAVYRRNGPSDLIGRFTYIAVIVYGLHLVIALATLVQLVLRYQTAAPTALLTVIAIILVSPFLLAQIFTFRRAGLSMSLQILILAVGGFWLTVL